ncbi:MAG: RDD family protein [Deltaproteobacteria bacterium]
MSLDIPSESLFKIPSDGPSDGATSRTAKNCSQCGMVYFDDELVQFGDALVCGKCKPLFVQKLKEGVTVAGEMVYAGFWIRFGAKFIDGILLGITGFVLGFLGSLIVRQPVAVVVVENVLSFALSVAYATYFVGAYSATPGKMACGLKVVRPDGEKISYARACGRFFAEFVSSLTLAIGYIMAAFDGEKRALHDRICDTRVIRA